MINSTHRTDILYKSAHEKNQSIIRLWCLYKGKKFNKSWLDQFFRAIGPLDSLQHYFFRLLLLKRMPTWYNGYMSILNNELSSNKGEISTMVSECLEKFTKRKIFDPYQTLPKSGQDLSEYRDILSIVSEVLARNNSN